MSEKRKISDETTNDKEGKVWRSQLLLLSLYFKYLLPYELFTLKSHFFCRAFES